MNTLGRLPEKHVTHEPFIYFAEWLGLFAFTTFIADVTSPAKRRIQAGFAERLSNRMDVFAEPETGFAANGIGIRQTERRQSGQRTHAARQL